MPTQPPPPTESLPLGQRQRLLLRLLRATPDRRLHRILSRLHPADIAPLFPVLKPEEKLRLLEQLFELRLAGRTLSELDSDTLREALSDFPDSRLAIVLRRLPADDAVDLLEQIEPDRRASLLSQVEPALATRLHNLMLFGDATAGGMMDPDVLSFGADQTVARTQETLRDLAQDRRLYYLYVTDDRGHLLGLVKVWRLLTARSDQILRQIMDPGVITVQVDTRRESVARLFTRYDLQVMPVLDSDGILVGIITVDDVIDVIEEEMSEDLYRLGGLARPVTLGTSLSRSLRLRLPWLGLGLIGALVAASVITVFEEVLARYVGMVAFMHIIGATGGDVGRQTLTLVTAAMATEEIDLWRPWKVVGRQCLFGCLHGLITGVALGGLAWLLERDWHLAIAVLIAQCVNQTLATLVASIAPLILRRLGLDPNLGTPTLVTALADITGFAAFLGLLAWMV